MEDTRLQCRIPLQRHSPYQVREDHSLIKHTHSDLSFKDIAKPLIYASTACGLFFRPGKKGILDICFNIYCIFIHISMIVVIIIMGFGYDSEYKPSIITKISVHLWYIQLFVISFHQTFCNANHYDKCLAQWDYYKDRYGGCDKRDVKTAVVRIVITLNSLTLIVGAPMAMYYFTYSYVLETQTKFAYSEYLYIFDIVLIAYGFLASFIWIQPFINMIVLCQTLKMEFKALFRDFQDALSEDKTIDIEHFRLRHIALCDITRVSGDITSFQVLVIYVMDIAMVIGTCFVFISYLLYPTYVGDQTTSVVFCGAFSLMLVILHLGVLTFMGASLDAAVSVDNPSYPK